MKRLIQQASALLTGVLIILTCAAWRYGNANIVPIAQGWHQIRIGGGGLEVGSDFPATGVRFVRSDDGGAYLWNTSTSKWQQILCQVCIPVNSTPGAYNFGLEPTTGLNQLLNGSPKPTESSGSVLGLAGAPSDASVAYVFNSGHVLVSTTVDPANPNNIAWVDTGPHYSSAITNATWAATGGGQATFTVTRLNNLCSTNCFFTVTGMNPSGFNGTYTAVSVLGNNITAALVSNPGAFVSGGTYHSYTADHGQSNSRFQRALTVDPNNRDHVIVGTQYDGIFETFNGTAGGSATWAPLSAGVPIQYNTGGSGANLIPLAAFDPNSGTTGGLTNTVYVWTPGATAGVYKTTTTTTGSWSLMVGSPSTAQNIQVTSATIGQGDVWVTDGAVGAASGSLWQFTGGTWNNRQTNCCSGGISVNPFNGNQIIAGDAKLLYVSTNGGSTFTTFKAGITATDAPWQNWMASRTFLTVGSISFDPVVNGQIWFTGGQGVWYTPTLPAANFNWISNVFDIETLINGSGIAIHAPYTPVFGAEDESGCQINVLTNATSPPSSCFPIAASKALTYYSNLYVPPADPTFMVGKGSANFGRPDFSGTSTDGFNQNFLPFNTWATTVTTSPVNPFTNVGGVIQVTVPDTSALTTWAPGNAGAANSLLCSYGTAVFRNPTLADTALNGGNYSCYTITVNDATHFTLNNSAFSQLGNPILPGYVFFAPATTAFTDWNGAFHVIAVADDGTGKVKVTIANSLSNEVGALAPVCVTGVTMASTTVVNGCWITASSSSGVIVLQDSTFVGGDSLVTAGTLRNWSQPAGSIAAATRNNIAVVGGDDGILQCSLDGGQTWTLNQPIPFTKTTVTGGPYTAGATSINLASTSGFSNGTQFHLMLDDGSVILLTQSGAAVGSTITFSPALPAGVSASSGNAIWTSSGYGFAAFGNLQMLAADYVQANTFYAVNINSGLYRWTNCGTPTLVDANTGTWLSLATLNMQVKTVPGETGHLFYSSGASGAAGDPHPANDGLWRWCGANTGTLAPQRMNGFFEVRAFGFGAPKPGSSYPTEWVSGWYDPGNVQANAVFSTWVSTDDPNHGATGSCNVASNAQTWRDIGGYPTGWNYTFQSISGDPYVYGMVYGGTVAGWYYGYFP